MINNQSDGDVQDYFSSKPHSRISNDVQYIFVEYVILI